MSMYIALVCLLVGRSLGEGLPMKDECVTYSRFDYEYKVIQKLVQQEEQLAAANERQEALQEQIASLKSDIDRSAQKNTDLELRLAQHGETLGSTYIRWGRTSCPENGTELVYPGYVGGSWYNHTGGAANPLCLPQDPQWGKYDNSTTGSARALVYGAEYETLDDFFPDITEYVDDVPCAVCRSPRPSVLMIPAKTECYGNWTLEYHGYLMAGFYQHNGASEFVCVDENPEAIPGGGSSNAGGKLFYLVEGKCGSLKCPPYVNGRELTCVVCSR